MSNYPIIIQNNYNYFSVKSCCFCNKKYRFGGFKIKEFNTTIRRIFFSYCCKECAKNKEDVNNRIEKRRMSRIWNLERLI